MSAVKWKFATGTIQSFAFGKKKAFEWVVSDEMHAIGKKQTTTRLMGQRLPFPIRSVPGYFDFELIWFELFYFSKSSPCQILFSDCLMRVF